MIKNNFFKFLPIIIISISVICAIFSVFNIIKVNFLTQKLKTNLNDNTLEFYLNNLKISYIPKECNTYSNMINVFFLVKDNNNISSTLKQEYCEILLSKGCNLGNLKLNFNKEKEILEAGKKGEETVIHYLDFLDPSEYIIKNRIYLKIDSLKQEFDHIIIGKNAIFNIETKNFSGSITIDEDCTWRREKTNGAIEKLENPLGQTTRHRKLLQRILGNDINIVDLIVISNPTTEIKGISNMPIKILTPDKLLNYIEEYENDLKIDDINKVNNLISNYEILTE